MWGVPSLYDGDESLDGLRRDCEEARCLKRGDSAASVDTCPSRRGGDMLRGFLRGDPLCIRIGPALPTDTAGSCIGVQRALVTKPAPAPTAGSVGGEGPALSPRVTPSAPSVLTGFAGRDALGRAPCGSVARPSTTRFSAAGPASAILSSISSGSTCMDSALDGSTGPSVCTEYSVCVELSCIASAGAPGSCRLNCCQRSTALARMREE